jgi:cyclopropane fatty-acyl-phospholipid synthase-like methyltransferase
MRDFGNDVFKGAAKYYSKYRANYPQGIFDDIAKNFKLDGNGRLQDLGCGTGELAIPLANYFKKY